MVALSLRQRALAALTRREHSRSELGRKLAAHATSEAEVERLLDTLEDQKLLCAARFAESLAHRRQARYGSQRIALELKQHQIDPLLIAGQLASLAQTETDRCYVVWAKRFSHLPENLEERGRQSRFLVARGFSGTCIERVLKGYVSD